MYRFEFIMIKEILFVGMIFIIECFIYYVFFCCFVKCIINMNVNEYVNDMLEIGNYCKFVFCV